MKFEARRYSNKTLIALYREMMRSRMLEERMLKLLRQGRIGKWFSGIGQEAVSIGSTLALKEEEFILPMHRNLGVFTSRNISLSKLLDQIQGKPSGFTKGRDRSFHFGSQEHHIVGMISHLGPQLSVANGIALANLLEKNKQVTLVFTGEGGTSEGEFHEALNIASVWNLPVIFLIENNGYSISTPVSEQYKIENFAEKGPAYAIETETIDGNNVLEVYHTIKSVAKKIQKRPRPFLIEAKTFRIRGHEESSGTDYVPKDLIEHWVKKDPIKNFEKFLCSEKILSQDDIEDIESELLLEIQEAVAASFDQNSEIKSSSETEDLFAPAAQIIESQKESKTNLRYIDAIREAQDQALARHQNLVIMGQDIAEYGGVFKATQGLSEKYGKDRVRNTPICESGVVGAGLGLSINGYKSIIEMQFGDFVSCALNQIVNNLAKIHYRWGQNADVVIRLPSGAGMSGGPFHSQSTEAWFYHIPGLKIVYPSTPEDTKGLLIAAVEDPNPVLFYEHRGLYRKSEQPVNSDYFTLEIGKGKVIQKGKNLTIVTYGMGVEWAKKLSNPQLEIIDLRSIQPWDKELVFNSVKKTGKAIVLTEDTQTGSIAADIAAEINENCFEWLDGPVKRLGSADTPIPFNSDLEANFLAESKLEETVKQLLAF